MQCKKCGKECMEGELTNGYCSDCIEKYGINSQEIHHKKNEVASVINGFFIAVIVIGCIASAFGLLTNVISGLLIVVGTFILAISLRAVSEIIQLLEDIKNK